MGKKRTGAETKTSERESKIRRSGKHVESLLGVSLPARNEFFEKSPPEMLLATFDGSHSSDLVNVLLDLKKATVKAFFELLKVHRRRQLSEVVTLYHYKEYLTNPLPLQIETRMGRMVPNYYAILGVPRDVSDDDLKGAYRLLVRAHAEECFSPPMRKAGAERLQEIHDAYGNLRSPQRRAKADRILPNISYLYPRRDQSWLEAVQRLLA